MVSGPAHLSEDCRTISDGLNCGSGRCIDEVVVIEEVSEMGYCGCTEDADDLDRPVIGAPEPVGCAGVELRHLPGPEGEVVLAQHEA